MRTTCDRGTSKDHETDTGQGGVIVEVEPISDGVANPTA